MKAVIFDMDGVIFDTEQRLLECWQEYMAKHFGMPPEEVARIYPKVIGMNDANAKAKLREIWGQDFPVDDFIDETLIRLRERNRTEGMPLKPGVRELLSYLEGEGYRIGLATSTRESLATEELRSCDLFRYFDGCMFGDQLKNSKPAPDIYLLACDRLQVKPEKTYAIEDSYFGIRSASAAGMLPIMVPDLLPSTKETEEKCVAIKKDLHEVQAYLDSQKEAR